CRRSRKAFHMKFRKAPVIVLGVRCPFGIIQLALFATLRLHVQAAPSSTWTVVRSSHFEVYSQAGGESARAALLWFEQLRAFFEQNGMKPGERAPVRVIGFRSASEYNAYRLRPTADAFYIGTESRDYIVMPALGANEFPVAAHEYAHLVLRASGIRLPPWLSEGLAEYFSTVRIGRHGWEIAGTKPAHLQILRQRHWMALAQLLTLPADSPMRLRREDDALFYAQSWGLTQMMVGSPQYRSRFAELVAAISSGQPSAHAVLFVYGRSLEAVGTDLHAWVREANARPVELSGMVTASVAVAQSEVSPLAS